MAESLEPHESPVKLFVGIVLKAVLVLGVIALIRYQTPEDMVTISPSQMRRVVEDMRVSQVEKLEFNLTAMRKNLAEMRRIRDTWIEKAGATVTEHKAK